MRKRVPSLLITFWLGLFSFFAHAQIGSLDTTFNPVDIGSNTESDNTINAIALQSDGKILIGGTFSAYNDTARKSIARLNAHGFLDVSFDPGAGANNSIYSIAVQADGKIIIGGAFTSYNGVSQGYIARLNTDGSLDGAFNPVVNDAIYALAVQPDGKVIIGGFFTTVNGVGRRYLSRLNADGTLDTSFDPGTGANNAVYALVLQSDGKVVIGGAFSTYNGAARNGVARVNTNGSIDTGFTPGSGATGGTVYSLALQKDGKVLIGGYFTAYNGTARNYIARINTNGLIDGTFTPGTGATGGGVLSIAVQSDNKIVIGGYFSSYNGSPRNGFARLETTGQIDPTFYPGNGTNDGVLALAIQSDGMIIIGGGFTAYGGQQENRIARINVKGATIIINAITKISYCAGNTITVPFTVLDVFTAGNKFTVQLSNASGSFAAPVTIGTVTGTASGTINAVIPIGTIAGTGYRVRVVSDKPAIASFDNGADLVINSASPTPTNTALGTTTFCTGGSVVLRSSMITDNQWYRNGVVITGAIEQTYTATTTGNYTVRNSENGCISAPSNTIAVTLTAPPTATIAYNGSPFCPVGTGAPTLTGKSGGIYSTTSDLAVNPSTGVVNLAVPAGTYKIDYTIPSAGGCPQVTTSTSIVIRQVISITTQPESESICTGATAKFTVVATGTGLTYQWRKGGVPISGATSATYTISNAVLTDAGIYSVQVKNACGEEISNTAKLDVTEATVISTQPVAQTVCASSKVTFSVAASGDNLTYQWRKGKLDIAGATGNSYTINSATTLDAGSYDVVVTGGCGVKTSASVALNVHTPLSITAQPPAQFVACTGNSANITVTTTGAGASYQWLKGNSPISEANSRTYTIPAPVAADAGSYSVVVSNACGTVTSSAVAVSVSTSPAKPTISAASNVLTSSAAAGNQWLYKGTAINGATARTYNPLANGLYTVRVTQGSCSATSEAYNFVYTRIDNPSTWNGEVSLYPNPVVKTLYLKNPASRKLYVQFFDVSGKKVLESYVRTTQSIIDIEGLASGVYQVMITDEAKNETVLQTIVKL